MNYQELVKKQGNKALLSKIISYDKKMKDNNRKIFIIKYEIIDPLVELETNSVEVKCNGYFDSFNFDIMRILTKWWASFHIKGNPSFCDLWGDPSYYELIGKEGYVHYVLRSNNKDPDGLMYLMPERFLTKSRGWIAKPKNAKNYSWRDMWNED